MSGQQQGEAERTRLSLHINAARQLTRQMCGRVIDAGVAEEITRRLKEVALLIKAAPPVTAKPKKTRRRQLWKRDPHCFWCGRVTNIRTVNLGDSATVEHIYHKQHPRRRDTRKHLPSTVLACYRCNTERGAPEVTTSGACPVIEQTIRADVA
ncbi:MAG: HNH endonuclease [Pyrinomonadaceae bacterium]